MVPTYSVWYLRGPKFHSDTDSGPASGSCVYTSPPIRALTRIWLRAGLYLLVDEAFQNTYEGTRHSAYRHAVHGPAFPL